MIDGSDARNPLRLGHQRQMISEGEWLVGGGTLALAAGTFWLAWQTRAARQETREDHQRRVLRAALAEQLENCRAWIGLDPSRGDPWRATQVAEPRLAAVTEAVDSLDLPTDVVGYVIWLTATINDGWGRIESRFDEHGRLWGGGRPEPEQLAQLSTDWRVILERLQVLAALIAGEAARRGFPELAAPQAHVPWTTVPERTPTWRVDMAIADQAYFRAPSFPADPAFAPASPGARDRAGAETGARDRRALEDAVGRVDPGDTLG